MESGTPLWVKCCWHWNVLSQFSDFLMNRHADSQERNLPPERRSLGCGSRVYPKGLQIHEPWVGAIFQVDPEARNEQYTHRAKWSPFFKNILNSRLSKCSTIFLPDEGKKKKKQWSKLKITPSLLWCILYNVWDLLLWLGKRLKSPRSYCTWTIYTKKYNCNLN